MSDNYYLRRFECTRNQYRRIVNSVAYQEELDGTKEDYKMRRIRILGKGEEE
tara:strand:- start:9554 stop:9709 length:156 start_codon:yes stop_codon:yes gene_type:complete